MKRNMIYIPALVSGVRGTGRVTYISVYSTVHVYIVGKVNYVNLHLLNECVCITFSTIWLKLFFVHEPLRNKQDSN